MVPNYRIDVNAYTPIEIFQMEDEEENSGSDFISEAIKSFDEQTASQETSKDYVKNFYNSAITATTESLNLFKPSTIITMVLNVLTFLLEIIGLCLTLLVMVLYNVTSSTFMTNTIGNVIASIEKIVFDWSNPNSWIIKIMIISCLVGILYQLIKNFTKLRGYKQIMQIVLAGILSTSFVVFIGQNGRKIVGALETTTQEMVVQTFVFDGQSDNMEIATKENIFNILQKQPFILRHFGVASANQLAEKSNQTITEANERIQKLLDDPTEDSADTEYDDYDNTSISHDPGSAMFILFISLLELVHRVLMSIVIVIFCVAVGAVKLMKELLLWLSIYQLLWWLIKRTRATQQWFNDRIMWSILSIAADILFSSALYFLMQTSSVLSEMHPLLMIGFDIILLVILRLVIKNMGTIIAKIKDNGEEVIKTMLVGSPSDVFRKRKNTKNVDESEADEDASDDYNDQDEYDEDLYEQDDSYIDTDDDLSDHDQIEHYDTDDSEPQENQEHQGESESLADDNELNEQQLQQLLLYFLYLKKNQDHPVDGSENEYPKNALTTTDMQKEDDNVVDNQLVNFDPHKNLEVANDDMDVDINQEDDIIDADYEEITIDDDLNSPDDEVQEEFTEADMEDADNMVLDAEYEEIPEDEETTLNESEATPESFTEESDEEPIDQNEITDSENINLEENQVEEDESNS